jgi:DNA polymerase-3 subunit alpha
MVKILSCKSLGTQNVYDLGVAQDHNFLLANGTVASNCFNKSHSTAYAYVTYQTAYLKANYPVEYMAALLTASSNSQDKVEKYIETCHLIGIVVEKPNVNCSQVDFTPVGDKILFGLSAVRNLGQAAIEEILNAREEVGGHFESLAQLCDRVDLRVVNRRAIETLVKCGALEDFNPNRKQLMQIVEPTLAWAQSRAKDRDSGQINIFDFLGESGTKSDSNGFEHAPQAPNIEDFEPAEKLKQEKELLGFYVSDHPLKAARQAAQILAPINLGEVGDQSSRQLMSAIVMVTEVRKIITKKGDPMAFIQLEDMTGQVDAVVFPRTYERIQAYLEPDTRLIVWGKADKKDDKLQLIVEDAEPIERLRMVIVEMSVEQAMNREQQNNLRGILQEQSSGDRDQAKVPVFASVSAGGQRQLIRFGRQFWVQDGQTTVEMLNHARFTSRIVPLQAS